MSTDHLIRLPKWIWILKIVQTIAAVIVLAISCFTISVSASGILGFNIFVSLYTIIILTYYFISLHSKPEAYNWIAALALEILAVIFWLALWVLMAIAIIGIYIVDDYYDEYYNGHYGYGYGYALAKRGSLEKRDVSYAAAEAAVAFVYTDLALGLLQFVLFCITLGFLGKAIHDHRKAGRPTTYSTAPDTSAYQTNGREEKFDMQPMPRGPNYQPRDISDYPTQSARYA